MASLKIRIYENGELETTITLPLFLVGTALKFLPKKAKVALNTEGADLEGIINSTNADFAGILVDIEEHKENSRVAISIE
jgi:hypothetical protein